MQVAAWNWVKYFGIKCMVSVGYEYLGTFGFSLNSVPRMRVLPFVPPTS